jgi:hypothetical protein
MKRIILLMLAISCSVFHSHNAIARYNQVSTKNDHFDSVLRNIQRELKNRDYIESILPHDFSYLAQLISYGHKTHQPQNYIKSVFKVFSNTLKRTDYINAYAFDNFLAQMPDMLLPYFTPYKAQVVLRKVNINTMDLYERLNESINTLMFSRFSGEFNKFKQNPDQFLNTLSSSIMELAQEEIETESLRQTVLRFLELSLGKLIWSPEDNEIVWKSVKNIAHRLARLVECNIIDDVSDLDDMFRTLIHRFCLFLDITGDQLPLSLYEAIKRDIESQELLLLNLEDQEPLLESKTECLAYSVVANEKRRRAVEEAQQQAALESDDESETTEEAAA